MKKKYADGKWPRLRKPRFCKCGCGHQLEPKKDRHGADKGYRRYIPGHKRLPPTEAQLAAIRKANQKHKKPIGSRRLHTLKNGRQYWVVKVDERKRWPFEHRHIVEQRIGRTLRSDEHVHHIDGNGLNNDPANLVHMSASAHAKLTGVFFGGPKHFMKGKSHRCPICKMRHEWPE